MALDRQPESAAHQATVPKQPLNLFRQRIRRDIEILRLDAQEQIAHAAPNQKRHVASIAEPVKHAQRVR